MKSFIDLVKKRRSIRNYRPDPVSRVDIEKCVEAASHAPTACNTQCCRFIITEGELKDRLVRETFGDIPVPNKWALDAPVLVVIATARSLVTHTIGGNLRGIRYNEVDTGIAGEHFILQATELGLGTCWIGWFKKKKAKKILDLPADWDICAMITVGYPAGDPDDIERTPLDKIREYRD